MKVIFHVHTSFFDKTIYLRVDTQINILKYFLIFNKLSFQSAKVFFTSFEVIHHNFSHAQIHYVFSVKVKEIMWLAKVFVKRRLVTVLPKHVYHFSILHVKNISFQRNQVDIFCCQIIDVKNKGSVEKILYLHSIARYVGQEVS